MERLGARLAGVNADQLKHELLSAVAVAGAVTQAEARLHAPVFTGEVVNGIGLSPPALQRGPAGISAVSTVFTTAPHSIVMEDGRSPGATHPPIGPIRRWVELKSRRGQLSLEWTGETGDKAVNVAAFVIASSIRRRGIEPRNFMEKAGELGEKVLFQEAQAAAERWSRGV